MNLKNKGAGFWQVIGMLLGIIVFILVLGVYLMATQQAKLSTQEMLCRTSLAISEKIYLNLPGESLDIKMLPFMCRTQEIDLSKKGDMTKEEVEKDLAELIARCWWQFGEGNFDKNVFGAYKLSWKTQDKCSICYKVTIHDIKDANEITKNDFQYFLRTKPYKYKQKIIENCENGIDDDGDGLIDNDDDDCYKQKDECEYKGGECKEYCISPYVELKDWYCSRPDMCCVNESKIITYQYYVEHLGGEGRLVILPDRFLEKEEEYVIAFSSETTSLTNDILRLHPVYRLAIELIEHLQKNPHTQVIVVSSYNDLRNHCNVWEE